MKILFICTGNTCRSPMAEGILKDFAMKNGLSLDVSSAGTHATKGLPAAQFAVEGMKDIGIDISNHSSNQVNREMLENADLVLTMSNSHKNQLLSQYPFTKDKLFLLNEYAFGTDRQIEDPFGAPKRYYEKARDQIYEAIEEIVNSEQ